MSTGLECLFVEREDNKWYYILENYDAPKDAWSWLDYATAYGPFCSFKSAKKHLDDNHANPGGYSVIKSEHYKQFSESRRNQYDDLLKYAKLKI